MSERPAVFLDRDGTIIVEREYLADPAAVTLIPGAAHALLALQRAGYALVVVTNQSGIARGYFGEAEYRAVHERMKSLLEAEGVTLDGAFHCPHHPEFTGPCPCRKPGLALFLEAAETLHLDVRRSIWIGDRLNDVVPAHQLGGRAFLVRTGYGEAAAREAPPEVVVCDDLAAVARAVLSGSAG